MVRPSMTRFARHALHHRHYIQAYAARRWGWISTAFRAATTPLLTPISTISVRACGRPPVRHASSASPAGVGRRSSPDRMFFRLRGHSGHHHEAWVRYAQAACSAASGRGALQNLFDGADAVRDITQPASIPPNCRSLKPARRCPSSLGTARTRCCAGPSKAPTMQRSTPGWRSSGNLPRPCCVAIRRATT